MACRRDRTSRYEYGAMLRLACPICDAPVSKHGAGKKRRICHSCGTTYSMTEVVKKHPTNDLMAKNRDFLMMIRQAIV